MDNNTEEQLNYTIKACTVARDIEILKLLKEMGLLNDSEFNDISINVNNYYGRPLILNSNG